MVEGSDPPVLGLSCLGFVFVFWQKNPKLKLELVDISIINEWSGQSLGFLSPTEGLLFSSATTQYHAGIFFSNWMKKYLYMKCKHMVLISKLFCVGVFSMLSQFKVAQFGNIWQDHSTKYSINASFSGFVKVSLFCEEFLQNLGVTDVKLTKFWLIVP